MYVATGSTGSSANSCCVRVRTSLWRRSGSIAKRRTPPTICKRPSTPLPTTLRSKSRWTTRLRVQGFRARIARRPRAFSLRILPGIPLAGGSNMTFCHRRFSSAALFLLLFCAPRRGFAHKDDYIDETLVFVTVERGEWELEYWFDLGWISNGDGEMPHQDFTRHNFAVEHGLTDHLMLDGRWTLSKLEGQPSVFDSGRLEGRYRFGEEDERPVDIAASGEINTERDERGKQVFGLEPRLILSKDIKAKL